MRDSAFGQVLTWVHTKLKEAEKDMERNRCVDPEQSIPNALYSIDKLLDTKKSEVKKACDGAVKAEYAALATFLQQTTVTMTPEAYEIARRLDE